MKLNFQAFFSHLCMHIFVLDVSVDQMRGYMHSRDVESECKLLLLCLHVNPAVYFLGIYGI